MISPNFLCVGAQKAGTSTLYDVLKQSPDVFFPVKKELHWFDKPQNIKKNIIHYKAFFNENYSNEKLIGEITPEYLFYEYVPKQILKDLGKIKIVILLRNPAARSYSQFNFHKMHQVEDLNQDFFKTIEQEKIVEGVSTYNTWCTPSYYLSKSMYYNQIKRYIDAFGRENVFIGVFEEMFKKDQLQLQPLFDFLELPSFEFSNTHSNPSTVNKSNTSFNVLSLFKRTLDKFIPHSITQNLATILKTKLKTAPKKISKQDLLTINNRYFIDDIKKLEGLINKDLSIWYK